MLPDVFRYTSGSSGLDFGFYARLPGSVDRYELIAVGELTDADRVVTLDELTVAVERATEGTRDLDEAIARYLATNHYEWWKRRPGPSDFTRSAEAALTLVPAGWVVANLGQGNDLRWYASLHRGFRTSYDRTVISGPFPTAAHALTVAALHAFEPNERTPA